MKPVHERACSVGSSLAGTNDFDSSTSKDEGTTALNHTTTTASITTSTSTSTSTSKIKEEDNKQKANEKASNNNNNNNSSSSSLINNNHNEKQYRILETSPTLENPTLYIRHVLKKN